MTINISSLNGSPVLGGAAVLSITTSISSPGSNSYLPTENAVKTAIGSKFNIGLMPGASETTGAASDAVLVGVADTSANWSELQYNDTTVQNGRWVIPSIYTQNYGQSTSALLTTINWYAAATSGYVLWQISMVGRTSGEVMNIAYDPTTSHLVSGEVAAVTNQLVKSNITFTPTVAELTPGDILLVQLTRVANDGVSDTLVGDAKVVTASIKEI